MDLRSTRPGLRAALGTGIFHPTKVHPHTGLPLEAVGVGKSGDIWWPIMGGAEDDDKGGDDDDADDDDDDDADDDADDDTDDTDDKDDDDKKKKKKADPAKRIAALEEEKSRHYKHLVAERKRTADLEARLKAIEEKGMKPEEIEERRKADQSAKDEAAAEALKALRLENAFLAANDITWQNKEHALKLLDMDEVEFAADGTVDRKSLRAALRRLAKANPHLVKPVSKAGDDDADGQDDGSSKQTASTMNGKRRGTKSTPSRADLAKRFPVLNRVQGNG
jgi:hypothetical protein